MIAQVRPIMSCYVSSILYFGNMRAHHLRVEGTSTLTKHENRIRRKCRKRNSGNVGNCRKPGQYTTKAQKERRRSSLQKGFPVTDMYMGLKSDHKFRAKKAKRCQTPALLHLGNQEFARKIIIIIKYVLFSYLP